MKTLTFTTSISGYDKNANGTLIVYFDKHWNEVKQKYEYKHAIAHGALQVKPHIGKVQEIEVSDTKPYILLNPAPSDAEIEAWKQVQEARKASVKEATEKQTAFANELLALVNT